MGYLIPVCILAFVASEFVKLLSCMFFRPSDAYNSFEGVRL